MIDVGMLDRAIAQLDEALAFAFEELAHDQRRARHFRAAAIQAFEFTYELTTKLLRRFLADTSLSPETVEGLDFSGLVRLGYKTGLLNEEITAWRSFRESRSITSHTYDEAKAQAVFAAIPRFLTEARHLRDQIKTRQANP
jgi:nucleotidyltransferase substrate binding protein (TIGR01987 family)